MKKNSLNLKFIILFISVYISLVYADNIRIPGFKWEKVDVVSNVGDDLPEERKDYAIGYSTDQDEIIIFGGRTVDNRILSDTWIFNLNQRSWRKPMLVRTEADPHPPGRYGMVYGNDQPPSNSFRNAFVITHGKGLDEKIYNDVWSFDFIRECWIEIKATGNAPEPRYNAIGGIDLTKMAHLNQLSAEYLIFSHGKNDQKYFTDTYILKLDGRSQQGDYSQLTAEWIKLNTNHAPSLKEGVTGNVLSSDRLVAFGGCEENGNCDGKGYYLDINFDYFRTTVEPEATWKEVKNECIRPKAYAASVRGSDLSVSDTVENDRLIIFGGLTEKKYGSDADGEISIFDMDKQKFFGVQPSSSNNNEFPKATKGAKMVATAPKSGDTNGFSVIFYGGEPINDDQWSTNIWKLNVYVNNFSYYPTPPEGVTMTSCYTIKEVTGDNNFNGDRDSPSTENESMGSLILFVLLLITLPALIIVSRALNCFTEKWKIIFLTLGALNLVLMIFCFIFSSNFKQSILIMKIVLACLLIAYMVFPFVRPKQPGIDFSQGKEVNAAGVPVEDIEEKNKKKLGNSSSSSLLIDSELRNNQAASEINGRNNNSAQRAEIKQLTIDSKYGETNINIDKKVNDSEKRESFLSPIFINPNVKEEAGDDDEAEESEIEDEDEVIKKQYLSRAKIWLNMLRIIGVLTLIGLIIFALLVTSSNKSKLYDKKIFIYIWIALVIILYIVAFVIAMKKHASMALLRARRISFRPSDPLEPNHATSWSLPADQMKRFSMISENSYGKTSAFDDIGNVSNYTQSVRNYNNANTAPSTTNTNVPVINGSNGSNVSPTVSYAIPPLPVTPVFMNNNGLFSVQSNYNYPNQNQDQVPSSSSMVNQMTSEMINIPTSDYQSYKDINSSGQVLNVNNNPNNNNNNININNNEKYSTSSSVHSFNPKEEKINNGGLLFSLPSSSNLLPSSVIITNNNNNGSITTVSNSNITNPSPQSQVQLLSQNQNQNQYIIPGQNQSNNSSPILEESSIPINMDIEQVGNLDFPQRNNTIEDMNDKEVMMVMTVPKRKLAVINM